jgi:hypothetical protein
MHTAFAILAGGTWSAGGEDLMLLFAPRAVIDTDNYTVDR